MSTQTSRLSESAKLKLFQAGEFTDTIDFTLSANTFFSLGSVNVSDLNVEGVSIFAYGHTVEFEDGIYSETLAPISNSSFTVNTSGGEFVAFMGYEYAKGIINFGVYALSTPLTPIVPFATVRIFYNVFYY